MAGIFDLRTGAFDSSEAALLHRSFDIALQGMRATHEVDTSVVNRLARSIMKVARSEPDSLRHDGTIDPPRLAQRAILRMLQLSAPETAETRGAETRRGESIRVAGDGRALAAVAPDSPGKIMMRLFERTPFAKL